MFQINPTMETFSLPIFLCTLSFFFLYLYLLLFHSQSKQTTVTPGFNSFPILGSLPGFLLHRHRFLDWSTDVLSKCPTNTAVFRRPGKVHGIITANPSVVEHMLKTNFDNYPKGTRFISLLQDFLGQGIFNSDGETWRVQRKTASYEFNTKSLRHFVMQNVTVELQSRFIPILGEAASSGRVIDLQDLLERFAFDNICKLAFNVDPDCFHRGSEFMRCFEDAAMLSSGRFMYAVPGIYKIKKFFNIGSEKRLRESIATVHEFADRIIRSRMEERATKKDEDLLSRFMGNSDIDNEKSPEFLRDIIISFILAGRDTTSAGLTWFFWLLSRNGEVVQKILEELNSIRAKYGKTVTECYGFEELREMHYLHAAISESLRLYPPVHVDTKACKEDDILPDGTAIKKGWFLTYHTYAMGRMEAIWGKDCCEYKPERWIDENGMCKQESPFKFPVFHAGLRMCLGKDMAYIQMKSIAASVIDKFEVVVPAAGDGVKDKCPEHLMSLTLRMKGGFPVKIKRR